MLRIDNSLLQEVGLGSLPDNEKNSLLKHILETLEMRVGVRLADQMTNEQLDEFERYFEAKDDAGAFKWLETNFPNYKEIVQEEFDKLKSEVTQSAPQILSSSQGQSQTAPAGSPGDTALPNQATLPQDPLQSINSSQPQVPTPQTPYADPQPMNNLPLNQPTPPTIPTDQPYQSPMPDSSATMSQPPFPTDQPPPGPAAS